MVGNLGILLKVWISGILFQNH